MPPRLTRTSLPSTTSTSSKTTRKAIRKREKRSLNAFAIAQQTDSERLKIRQHRLGEVENDDGPRRKRQRMADDDDDDDDEDNDEDVEPSEPKRKQQKGVNKGGYDELYVSAGSDSEGNEWKMGVVGDEEDEEIDSDEAFGESDEERFEGWTFRASSKGARSGGGKKAAVRVREVNLDEHDEEEVGEDEEEDEDDLGDDAIDLATALDQYDEMESADEADYEGDSKVQTTRKKAKAQDVDMEEEQDESDSDDSAPSSDEGDLSDDFARFEHDSDDNNAEKIKQLHNVVASLPQDSPADEPTTQTSSSATAARMLAALKGMSGVDPTLTRSLKTLSRATEPSRSSSKTETNNGLLKAPLPKRQQDRLDRAAAYDKAKETLNRWIDTVKHNRRAEHLTFPLIDPLAQEAQGTSKLLPLDSTSKPRSELENTIANILQASGLGSASSKTEEETLRGFEELKTNKLPLEEVLARRAELRKARDLMFREEARSKRVKKIKSKAYRRIHRKEAARTAQKERDLLAAAGVDVDEDGEDEAADRRRAEARMGARHKESKWARSVKETGRGAWDDDSRDAMTALARKNEEVMMRKEGRRVRGSDESQDESEDNDDEDDEDEHDGDFTLRNQLDRLDQPAEELPKSKSGINQLAFMKRADAARKQQNDEDIARMRRELNGEESDEEKQPLETSIGRRIFGPSQQAAVQKPAVVRGELEEGQSDSEDEDGIQIDAATAEEFPQAKPQAEPKTSRAQPPRTKGQLQGPAMKAKPHVPTYAPPTPSDEATLNLQPSTITTQEATEPSNTDGWTVVHYPTNDDGDISDADADANEAHTFSRSPSPTNLELVQAAFGTADDETTFQQEKKQLAKEEDTQTTSTALPGWGSWTGSGLTKGERSHASRALANQAFIKTTAEGVDVEKRRDRKLKDVIISERRNKKGAKYLAPVLPHQFETRAQYERSLRLPIGPEWTTKETFQQATKPRVLLKKGVIVKPMERPMV